MTLPLRHRIVVPLAVILITLASLASAALMAPERTDAALAQAVGMGLTADDLCADDAHDHDHRCPFCRLLDDPGTPAPDRLARLLRPHDAWLRLESLTRAAQARDADHAPRAPPTLS